MTNNKEEIDKHLILKNVTPIRPIPMEYILKAMDEYAKNVAIEFAKLIMSGKYDGGKTYKQLYSLWEQTKK